MTGLTVSDASFSTANSLIFVLATPVSTASGSTERFTCSISNGQFAIGSFTFNATLTRIDTSAAWGDLVELAINILYR
jgi:hypothetical protein